jgi:putative sigma-54 modulation protein
MNIIIKSVNFKASNALETFVKEKVGKLFNYSNDIIRANVILRKGENNSVENQQCQIILMIPGNDHIVKRKAGLYEKSILESVEVLQKILRRNKTKLIARRSAKSNY